MTKKKIQIIGATGFLGSKIYQDFSQNYKVTGTYFKNKNPYMRPYDLTKFDLTLFKEIKPNIVIHTAAMTDVDECETNPQKAYQINVEGTKNVIEGCRINNSKLIYISTDFVFDGKAGDYKETDLPNPLNFYAKTKLKAEQIVKDSGLNYIIARVAVLYGQNDSQKFVNWCINKLRNQKQVFLINDHIRTPTLIDDISSALEELIERKFQGIIHITGPEKLSAYQMGIKIAETFGLNKKYIKSITSDKFKQKAERPKDSSLNIEKLQHEGIKMSKFIEGLKKISI